MGLSDRLIKNPINRKRFQRLKEMKRAYISLWILIILYVISFGSELICNDNPLYVKFEGQSYFPVLRFYPEDTFTGSGKKTRPDFHKIRNSQAFKNNSENYMIFPPVPFGPYGSADPESIDVSENVTVKFNAMPLIGTVNVRKDYSIARSAAFGPFVGKTEDDVKNLILTDYLDIPARIQQAVNVRFANQAAPAIAVSTKSAHGKEIMVSLSTFSARKRPPKTVRLTFRENISAGTTIFIQVHEIELNRELNIVQSNSTTTGLDLWQKLTESARKELLRNVESRFFGPLDNLRLSVDGRNYSVAFVKEDVRFPFRPVKGHIMGIDGAGRDVFARILYGLRTSMTFGLLLVITAKVLGIIVGALQGYYGGVTDITGQRLIEIWSALPFLYIMILMGSVYGRSFPLLLFCYGIFNWIGISYYMRAEFLRLRKQPFVEAAKCMGIASYKVIFKHILPNGLVPVITFLPFSLVGAIGALAALDYLGFGLPPPTPSWGELLFQAQQYRWAWWLILYPSLALFTVMLLGVFIGEGIRNAYDPKRYTRLE
jgi:microcin C transport system permease protein